MDPQHRLLLEVVWEALEDALIPPDRLAGTAAGVFVGMCNYDYAQLAALAEGADGYAGIGGAPSIAAGRIAYLLGLTGPAMVVDTACSSSLAAVHLAVQALRTGECSLALAGGVNLAVGNGTTTALEQLHMLSPDGRCKAFDADADGFVRGEGCGVVVLKRLVDAEAAGDRMLGVIRGSALNQDGRSAGLTAPNGPAQEAVIRAALMNAGLAPAEIDYIEAHGTGTALGDPIEMHALKAVFAGRERPLLVGSVKSNIGHAEAAAGIAGLIKAVLMLRHQRVPASLNYRHLNPHIDLAGVPIAVPTALREADLTRIGVSSFGFSGTNAHVVLERAPPETATVTADAPHHNVPHQLLISARTPEALRTLIDRYRALLDDGVAFADLCHSAAVGRARLPWWVCVDHPDRLAAAQPSEAAPPELPAADRASHRPAALPVPAPRLLGGAARSRHADGASRTPQAAIRCWAPGCARRWRSGNTRRYSPPPARRGLPITSLVNDKVVMPAAGLIEMLLAALPAGEPLELGNIAFRQILVPDERPIVQTIVDPATRTLRILAAEDSEDAVFSTIAEASWQPAGIVPPVPRDEMRAAAALGTGTPANSMPTLPMPAFPMAPLSAVLRSLSSRAATGIAIADLPPKPTGPSRLDPRVLDAAWQSLAAALPTDGAGALVPAGLGSRWSGWAFRRPAPSSICARPIGPMSPCSTSMAAWSRGARACFWRRPSPSLRR